jgi:hypothetical protein
MKAGTYLLFDEDKNTRHRMNFSFLKMGGLSEHEGRANLIDCTLISRFSARKGDLSNHAEDASFGNG